MAESWALAAALMVRRRAFAGSAAASGPLTAAQRAFCEARIFSIVAAVNLRRFPGLASAASVLEDPVNLSSSSCRESIFSLISAARLSCCAEYWLNVEVIGGKILAFQLKSI